MNGGARGDRLDYSVNQRPFRRRLFRDTDTLRDQLPGPFAPRLGIVVNGGQRFVRVNSISDLLMQNDPDREIDGILLALAPAAKHHASGTDLLTLHR